MHEIYLYASYNGDTHPKRRKIGLIASGYKHYAECDCSCDRLSLAALPNMDQGIAMLHHIEIRHSAIALAALTIALRIAGHGAAGRGRR
ncbi:hypothetical protein [Sphingobium yanoikuyae]|uniref:hypothetical protein n=1 Tax=Sphingobium yanoikuyae TaxID=13690 RepID=UPI001F355C75|nr:hypothetical protein [Sphingobium yanoikuyae]